MKHLKFILLFILFTSSGYTETKAQQNIAFADIDLIIKNTNAGKATLEKINKVNKENIEKLKSFEKEIKTEEDKINKKKNLISNEEFQKEINKLRIKLNEFNTNKDLMSNSFGNYGESCGEWEPSDVKGFVKIISNQNKIYQNVISKK